MLSILRTLPMVRFAFFALVLAALLAVPAAGTPAPSPTAHRHGTTRVHHHARHAASRATHAVSHHATVSHRATATHHATHRAARSYASHAARPAESRVRVRRQVHHRARRRTAAYPYRAPRLTRVSATRETAAPELDDRTPAPQDFKVPAPEAKRTIVPVTIAPDPIPLRQTRIVAIAPLRGSLESLERQNEKTEADGLERILDDNDLNDRIARGMLVPVPVSAGLMVNPELPQNRRYCRPWTATFLADLARAHEARFHTPLDVSSAVRTVEYQKRLMEINGNAAQAEGDIASPHLTGATIDIAKQGLSRREIYWMRDRLNSLEAAGKIDVEEEFHQSCFHITVYKSYVGAGPLHMPRQRVTAPVAPAATDPSSADPDSADPPRPPSIASGGR